METDEEISDISYDSFSNDGDGDGNDVDHNVVSCEDDEFASPAFDVVAYVNNLLDGTVNGIKKSEDLHGLPRGNNVVNVNADGSQSLREDGSTLSVETLSVWRSETLSVLKISRCKGKELLGQIGKLTKRQNNVIEDLIKLGHSLNPTAEILESTASKLITQVHEAGRGKFENLLEGLSLDESPKINDRLNDEDPDEMRERRVTDIVDELIEKDIQTPSSLSHMLTLWQVRNRLNLMQEILQIAQRWPISINESTISTSLTSVMTSHSQDDLKSREQAVQAFTQSVRTQFDRILINGDVESLHTAKLGVAALSLFVRIWKGTKEEKYRQSFVEEISRYTESAYLKQISEAKKLGEFKESVVSLSAQHLINMAQSRWDNESGFMSDLVRILKSEL